MSGSSTATAATLPLTLSDIEIVIPSSSVHTPGRHRESSHLSSLKPVIERCRCRSTVSDGKALRATLHCGAAFEYRDPLIAQGPVRHRMPVFPESQSNANGNPEDAKKAKQTPGGMPWIRCRYLAAC